MDAAKEHSFEWDPSLSVGDETMDGHHRELFALAGRAWRLTEERAQPMAILEMLGRLIDYIDQHFEAEEELLRGIGFAGYDRHKQAHERIVAEIGRYMKEQDFGRERASAELAGLLDGWIRQHILTEDAEYGKALKAAGH